MPRTTHEILEWCAGRGYLNIDTAEAEVKRLNQVFATELALQSAYFDLRISDNFPIDDLEDINQLREKNARENAESSRDSTLAALVDWNRERRQIAKNALRRLHAFGEHPRVPRVSPQSSNTVNDVVQIIFCAHR
jgi:hypothetical protein